MEAQQYCYVRKNSSGVLGTPTRKKDSLVTAQRMSAWRRAQEKLPAETKNLKRFRYDSAGSYANVSGIRDGRYGGTDAETFVKLDLASGYGIVPSIREGHRLYGGGDAIRSGEEPTCSRATYVYLEFTSELESQFNQLAEKWYQDVGAESSLTKITGNINYLRIVALGRPVLPLILRRLQREPAPWFLALSAISGELNIGKEYAGDFRKMANAWVKWGRANGYI